MQYVGLAAGSSLFTINDVILDASTVDLFHLLKTLSQHSAVLTRLQHAGVPPSLLTDLQSLKCVLYMSYFYLYTCVFYLYICMHAAM